MHTESRPRRTYYMDCTLEGTVAWAELTTLVLLPLQLESFAHRLTHPTCLIVSFRQSLFGPVLVYLAALAAHGPYSLVTAVLSQCNL